MAQGISEGVQEDLGVVHHPVLVLVLLPAVIQDSLAVVEVLQLLQLLALQGEEEDLDQDLDVETNNNYCCCID